MLVEILNKNKNKKMNKHPKNIDEIKELHDQFQKLYNQIKPILFKNIQTIQTYCDLNKKYSFDFNDLEDRDNKFINVIKPSYTIDERINLQIIVDQYVSYIDSFAYDINDFLNEFNDFRLEYLESAIKNNIIPRENIIAFDNHLLKINKELIAFYSSFVKFVNIYSDSVRWYVILL